jgi:hypothetical protein
MNLRFGTKCGITKVLLPSVTVIVHIAVIAFPEFSQSLLLTTAFEDEDDDEDEYDYDCERAVDW